MRKLILEEWVSLDGHVADRNGGLDFFTSLSPERNTYSDADQLKFLDTVDTILLGRRTYELFVAYWPTVNSKQEVIAERLNATPKVVVSSTLKAAPWGQWAPAAVVQGDPASAITHLKAQPGKNIVLWGSISLAQSLLEAQLVDEIHLQLCPVITGGGRRLFAEGCAPRSWHLQETRRYPTGTVFLSYRNSSR